MLSGVRCQTVTIDIPVYLNYLLSRFLAAGGSIVRGTVQHISQIIEGGTQIFGAKNASSAVDAVVVCAGLGARFLGGVEDKNVHPIRGQTVLLRAPWIKFGSSINIDDASQTYIIPRRSGDVPPFLRLFFVICRRPVAFRSYLGGPETRTIGKTRRMTQKLSPSLLSTARSHRFPVPRSETTADILQRCLALCPELAPPEIRKIRQPTVEDLSPIIIEGGCGLRPGRSGGIRLEVEWFDAAKGEGKVPIIYNYG